ncbi:MAG: deoxynucleoside kinase [Chitinophagales bacterium]
MKDKYNFITVEGNTGAGKTTLAQMLAEQYKGNLILEDFVDNPFLPKFYIDRERYAFPCELYFLMDRQKQLSKVIESKMLNKGFNISDYLLNKSLLYGQVNLKEEEFQLYARVFHSLYPQLPEPELVIYVHSTVPRLIKNIRKRGRGFEQGVDPNYLQKVEELYMEYFRKNPQLKVLILHADNLDFVAHPEHYEQILDWVNRDYEGGITNLYLED